MWAGVRSWFVFVILLWVAHVAGYLVHEYAHSFLAWAVGYKANPVALNYGHLSIENLVFLSGIDENVDYGPIFAAGKGYLASSIAVPACSSATDSAISHRASSTRLRRERKPQSRSVLLSVVSPECRQCS